MRPKQSFRELYQSFWTILNNTIKKLFFPALLGGIITWAEELYYIISAYAQTYKSETIYTRCLQMKAKVFN